MKSLPYIAYAASTQVPDAPKLVLELAASTQVSRTVPFTISFKLRTEERSSVVIDWNLIDAMLEAQFVLLHNTKDGLERCAVEKRIYPKISDICVHSEVLQGEGQVYDYELGPAYHECLRSGETYVFFWPGKEITKWEMNTRQVHLQRKHCGDEMNKESCIILPASNALEFTVYEESDPWPEREKWVKQRGFWAANLEEQAWRLNDDVRYRAPAPMTLTEAEREFDAPILTKDITGLPVLNKSGKYMITETITYEKTSGTSGKPITFLDDNASTPNTWEHKKTYSLLPRSGYGLEAVEVEEPCMLGEFVMYDKISHYIPDDELEEIVVGENLDATVRHYHTLYPGESISSTTQLYRAYYFYEEPLSVGEIYTYQFNGKRLRWWAWGTLEEHRGTRISGFDDQTPKIVIPAASCGFVVEV